MSDSRHRLRSLLAITYLNGVVPIRTQPLYLVNILASPLSFLFFIVIASHGVFLPEAVGGGMILMMLSMGTSVQTDMTHYRQDLKFQDVMVASPIEAPIYVAGLALSELVYALPGLFVFLLIWIAEGWANPQSALVLTGVLLLSWAFASALGFTLATYFEDVRETFVFSPLISLALSVLPPVYYPITALPAMWRPLAYLSPTTYAADLIHGAMGLGAPPLLAAGIDWLVLIAFTVALVVLAAYKARWREP
ncbi:MAG: ABC transporter permease [Thermoplasmata archaeon]|nr:ABC transporter permease [Thermoplasmata archaeon]